MSEDIVLRLPSTAVYQILDGLYQRTEAWNGTARFLEIGDTDPELAVEDCDGPEEARAIAGYYEEIITEIEKQCGIN